MILTGSLNTVEECALFNFKNAAYQVRYIFDATILFYFILVSLLYALLVAFHFVFTKILRYNSVQFVWVWFLFIPIQMENARGRRKHKDMTDNRNIVLVFNQLLDLDKFYFGPLVCNHIVILSKRLHITSWFTYS